MRTNLTSHFAPIDRGRFEEYLNRGRVKIQITKEWAKAFTLIEVLVSLTVISMVATVLVSGYYAAYKSVDLATAKTLAVNLANEKMEFLKNLSYDDLATQHGTIYPAGNILDNEEIVREGINYNVHISISYVDDLFDGNAAGTVADKPVDIYPYDYKKIEVTVGKADKDSQLAKITSNMAAKAAETPSNTGILYLCIIDSLHQPVPEATVKITNSNLSPIVSIETITGADGCVVLPKLPEDTHNQYHIEVTKGDFSTDMTYPRTPQNPNALQPDANIIIQKVTNLTLTIDRNSTMRISFVNQNGEPVPNVTFTLEGMKKTYTNPDTFKYSKIHATDETGSILLDKMEFDQYKIKDLAGGYFVVSTIPMQEINLAAGANLEVTAILSTSGSMPRIYNFLPVEGINNSTVSITINGENFNNGIFVKLVNSLDNSEILPTNIEVHPHTKVEADFDLNGKIVGKYNLVVMSADGTEIVVQKEGFTINAP